MTEARAPVLITGATGFVGRMLVERLAGENLRLALRSANSPWPQIPASVVGELGRTTDWSNALAGVECVIHLAARVHVMKASSDDEQRFDEINVQGTRRLVEAAGAAGVKRFVFLSSIKVNGEATVADAPFTADDRPQPQDAYGRSKWHAEQAMFEIAQRYGMQAFAIRSPLVYGPGVRANFLRLMKLVERGWPLPLGAVENRRSMISVWNLCDLIACASRASAADSAVLMASDGEDLSTAQLIRHIAAAMGRRPLLLPVPPVMLQTLGRLTGRQAELSRLLGSLRVDIAQTRARLGWSPPLSVRDGIQRTVDSFVAERDAHGT